MDMADENYGFCPSCGANLTSDAAFCPECGKPLTAEAQNNTYNSGVRANPSKMCGKLLVAFILLLIYAVMDILGGISLVAVFNESFFDSIDKMLADEGEKSLEEMFKQYGLDMSRDDLINYFRISGIVSIISGALAGVAAYFCAVRKMRMVAVGLTVVAALANFAMVSAGNVASGIMNGIFAMIIGGIVAYLIYDSQEQFRDEN